MSGIDASIASCGKGIRRKLGVSLLGLAGCALGMAGLTPTVRADDTGQPARAVRLSSVDGQVQLSQGKQVVAEAAVANTPLFEGATVTTADDGRAEIQFEDGSVARLSPNSAVTLTTLRGAGASAEAVITLSGGLGYFETQGSGQAGAIKIQFADSLVSASGFTVMRINLDTPPGELAVFSGNAHLERGNALTVDLHGGESVALNSQDSTRYTLKEAIDPDSWDSWNSDRDQALTSEAADKTGATKDYADSGNPAWNDLDANGNWYNVPGQGNVWSPYEASSSSFDPYGYGNWGYSPGFGYTWISGYSWGYMPYQCGAWNFYDSFGWGWAPGMGGCSPWWNGGGYLGPNIGIGYGGYRPPLRPHPPRRPFGGVGLIAVGRRPMPMIKGSLPARDRGGVVVIAGHAVAPLHPVGARPQYDHSASGFVNHTVISNAEPRGGNGQVRSGPTAAGPTFGTARSGAAPAQHAPSGGSPHFSAGGGGGSASHVSGGSSGGGGGGGASHGGGGGGGGGGGSHH
jgi:hypothetical protein